MFKLAHISDVHLRPLPKATLFQLLNKRILGYLNWKLNRRNLLAGDYLANLISDMQTKTPDHVLVTGDLVNIALPEEFEQAANFLKLLGEPQEVTAICGNHDAYLPGSIKQAFSNWREYMSGDDKPIQSSVDYPIVRMRGDVALIACNSAEATLPFFATGYFRKKQAERLEQILEATNDKCRVIFIHHPPFENATHHHKRLIGRHHFQNAIAKYGAELVLHGHTHRATINELAGPKGTTVPVVCVPAAGHANDVNDHPAGRYNLFKIEGDREIWSIEMEEYGLAQDTDGIRLVASHKLS